METLRKFEKVLDIVDKNDRNPARLIPILQAVQTEYRYLPEEILTFVATSLGISPAKVFGVATFYSLFTLKPKGKYVSGSAMERRVMSSAPWTSTTPCTETDISERERIRLTDMLFTLETVNCLGACGLAPAMVVNDEASGNSPQRGNSDYRRHYPEGDITESDRTLKRTE